MYTKDQILAYLEENRAELERIFPECEGFSDDELFDHFFAVESTTSTADDFIVYEDNKFCLKSKFDEYDIPSLNKFRKPL